MTRKRDVKKGWKDSGIEMGLLLLMIQVVLSVVNRREKRWTVARNMRIYRGRYASQQSLTIHVQYTLQQRSGKIHMQNMNQIHLDYTSLQYPFEIERVI